AKELKEREQAALIQPPTPSPKAGGSPPSAPPGSPEPPPATVPEQSPNGSASAPANGPATLVDINRATSAELSLTLEMAKEDSDKLIKNRPYKTKEELITKAGIAKATVDKIRDRIIVGP